MRRLLAVLFVLVPASATFAADLLGPADYLKILIDSKLHYNVVSEPSKTPVQQMTCDRRNYSLRLVTKGDEKSLVPWTVKPEATKLLGEAEALFQAKKIDEAGLNYKAATEADPQAVSGYLYYESSVIEARKKQGITKPEVTDAETIGALSPLDRHIYEVSKAGMLDGCILFEIIGQRSACHEHDGRECSQGR
jgi:hypothetical protein